MFTFSTTTRSSPRTRVTTPRRPLSRPAITTTSSPFLMRFIVPFLQHFRRERNDLHEPARAQLARDRPENARADRLEAVVQEHGSVAVEPDRRAVGTAKSLLRAHDHRVVDLALLHAAARDRVLDRDLDHVADPRIAALRAAEHLDAHQAPRARVVGRVQYRLRLNHRSIL